MNLKHNLYSLIPKPLKKRAKNLYYIHFLRIIYSLKHKFYYGNFDFFEVIQLETTTYCNLRCEFCPNSKYERGLLKNKKLMDLNLFKKIIKELKEIKYRGKVMLFSYGDPLTDDRLTYLVSYTKQKLPKAKVAINSNGLLLTISIYKELIKAGIDNIFISQYGKVMLPNVKKVLRYIAKRPKKENKIKYRGILHEEELSNRGGEIEQDNSANHETLIFCHYPGDNALVIDYAGNLILCCNDYHGSVKFGNLEKEKLTDILDKSTYTKIMKETRNNIYNLEICKKCAGLIK